MNCKIKTLKDRSYMLGAVREFFKVRNIFEVDCPLITRAASVDAHIDLISVRDHFSSRYLHSSPEYGMKRLLADGIGDIYQLAHVFRNGEQGMKHNPEFMMAEWYRLGFTFEEMIEETVNFIRLFLGDLSSHQLTYRQAFQQYVGFDYHTSSEAFLLQYLLDRDIAFYDEIAKEGKDALLNVILGTEIEPKLGEDGLCVLAYYPSTQAALAKTLQNGNECVAERFEIYYKGIELANGYHELADAQEQRARLKEANALRVELGKELLPIDECFLKALEKGLPDCCGVAVGFDRLMMLRHQKTNIQEVIPFSWDEA